MRRSPLTRRRRLRGGYLDTIEQQPPPRFPQRHQLLQRVRYPTAKPAETPWRLALVLVFQFMEGLSDGQVADVVRGRIDWKYALSLELTDDGFDASVLNELRQRLVQGSAEMQLLEER